MGGDKLFPRARPLCCRRVVPPTRLGRHSGQRPCCRADEPPGEHSRGLRWTRAGPAGKPETPEGRGGSPEGTLGAQSAPALTPGLAPAPEVTRGLSLGVRAGCTLCLPRAPLRSQGATPPAGRGSGGHTRTCPSLRTACPLEATGSTRPGVSGARTPPTPPQPNVPVETQKQCQKVNLGTSPQPESHSEMPDATSARFRSPETCGPRGPAGVASAGLQRLP